MHISDRIFLLHWTIKISRGKLVGGDVHSSKFLSHKILPRKQYFFYIKGLEKTHTQKQWLNIMDEILPIRKFLLVFFGIQYKKMLQTL